MEKYKLILQDTFKHLILNDIYFIKDSKLYNKDKKYTGFILSTWQIENMFERI